MTEVALLSSAAATLYDALVAPWTWGTFFGRALAAGVLLAVPAALLGCLLHLRRMALLVDALAHVALPGLVMAWLVTGGSHGPGLLLGAAASGTGTAWGIERLQRVRGMRADAATGIVFTTFFAAGVVLLSTVVRDAHLDLDCLLFGNLLGVSDLGLVSLALVAPLVGLFVAWRLRALTLLCFDPVTAQQVGVRVGPLQQTITVLASLVAVAGFEAVGAILCVALFVLPPLAAQPWARSISGMLFLAALCNVVAVTLGLYAAVWWDLTPGGSVVAAACGLTVVSRAAAALRPRFSPPVLGVDDARLAT